MNVCDCECYKILIIIMGAVCGNSNKRIVPKTKKATLGLRSGQTIDS